MKKDNRTNGQVDNGVSEDFLIDFLKLDNRASLEIFGKISIYNGPLVKNQTLKNRIKEAKLLGGLYDLNLVLGIPKYKKVYNKNEIKLKFKVDFITDNMLKDNNIILIKEGNSGSYYDNSYEPEILYYLN